MTEWYEIENINEIDTPALVVYPDRARKNIETAIKMVKDVGLLRPHVKTNKSKDACRLMLTSGITKFKCATIAEAEMLGSINAPDVLLAYQPTGPKILRLIQLIKKYRDTHYSCLVDNNDSAREIAAQAINAGLTIPVFIDVNVGMNRTGIVPGQKAVELYELCGNTNGIQPLGLHVYDGHITDTDLALREKRSAEAFELVDWLRAEIQKKFPEPTIIAGGSPSFPVHAKKGTVQCSPGTFIYWDAGYLQKYPEQKFVPAALVASRIISLPNETTICADLGHKSVSAENQISHRVQLLNAPGLEILGQSEEHLVLKADAGHTYKVGDVLYGIPWHICPTCALYERALIVEDNNVTGEWKTIARDRKINV